MVSRKGIATDPEKPPKYPTGLPPTTVIEVQQFLGLASYYQHFVKEYVRIASSLHKLSERGRQFIWTNECAEAFSALKHKLTHAPVLYFPDFTRPFVLDTDASHTGIGAVLSQIIDGQETIIAKKQ